MPRPAALLLCSLAILATGFVGATSDPNPCSDAITPGPCKAYMPRWAYDAASGACAPFIWGGCQANRNNFLTEKQCQSSCKATPRCQLPAVAGPCEAYIPTWHFNTTAGKCMPFVYGGCQGNPNRFESETLCKEACSSSTSRCQLAPEQGPCKAIKPRWHWDDASSACKQFNWGGCGGNANRFLFKAGCEAACKPSRCQLPPQPGNCLAYMPSWHWDAASSACKRFVYGGCGGNDNRFSSKKACLDACSPK